MTAKQDRVARLREELCAAEQDMLKERDTIRAATPIEYRYEIAPVDDPNSNHKLYDPTTRLYKLTRYVANADAARKARHPEHELTEGSMTYAYNVVSRRIICAVSGGTVYITPGFPVKNDGADDRAYSRIGVFLYMNPDGGDITPIVSQFYEERHGTN